MTDDDVILSHRLADAAGAAILPYFRAAFGLEIKPDQSPVTLADRAAESAIRAILEIERPGDGIIGEEYGSVREGAARQWVLDPIDGTRAFVAGRPIFGTLIALMEDGVPVLGIIDQPVTRERWLGVVGRPTLLNGKACAARKGRALGEAIVATTSPAAFSPATLARFTAVIPAVRDVVYGGDCYNYGLVASGHIDLVIEAGLKIHDLAALVPVVEGAGGRMCDWQGRSLDAASDGNVIAMGDAALAGSVLGLLNV